jgi:type VI secretion system secreted protein Hcp
MKRKLLLGAAIAAVAVAGAATYAWAASSATSQTLNACVDKAGNIRLVAGPGACRKNEQAISWNTTGPAGPAGPAGTQGAQGPQGPAGASTSSPDAATGTVQVTAQVQGTIGPFDVQGLSHEIVVPHDEATGAASGKTEHQPIVITKTLDSSTPKLLQALVTNENLKDVLIGLDEGGTEVATIELTNANISDYQAHGTSESWSFTYQKITWTWLSGGITTSDNWSSSS